MKLDERGAVRDAPRPVIIVWRRAEPGAELALGNVDPLAKDPRERLV